MTSDSTAPAPLSLPTADWEAWLAERCDGQLDQARAHVETLRQGGHDSADVLALWNDLNLALHNAFQALATRSPVALYTKRVPSFWVSKGAPRLGWCWAGNPHTWLGAGSAATRLAPDRVG